jgi:HD-GYP domain-containing protein (c-di-GMP phosphodiesterase class II)
VDVRLFLRPRLDPSVALFGITTTLPALALVLFGQRHVELSSTVHFAAVGASALAAFAASFALSLVGARRRDARTVLVGTAFSAMAALLLLHGLASPGVIVEMNGLVAFSGAATLPVGAAVLSLCALPVFRGPRAVLPLLVLQWALLTVILGIGVLGLAVPTLVPEVPETGGAAALATVAIGLVLYAFVGFRALDTFSLTRRALDGAVVVGLGFLATALVAALLLEYFQLGWWLGHLFELIGLVIVGATVVVDLHRSRQSRPLSGGVAAAELVAAEETFLGARVRALTVRLAEKDASTEEHTRRVALRAVQVGERLGLPPVRLRNLATGGLLHDIGKLAVPDGILRKPGPLTEEEYDVVRRHPEWGHHLLADLGDFPDEVRRLVRDHHERLDGSGYPHGLSLAQLDLETRILAVCDVYDALISTRVYREAWTHDRALAFLREQAGTEFDRGCVEALERVLRDERGGTLDVAV